MGRLDLPDPHRDEDDDDPNEAFWARAGVHETITPEIRARVDAVKAARDGDPVVFEARLSMSEAARRRATTDLSEREIEIIAAVAEGLRNKQIGVRLFLSEETIKSHIRHIIVKLDARNRAHVVALAYQRRILRLP